MQSWNLVFLGPRELEVRREPVPEPGPRQLLVRTSRTLISVGTELICYLRQCEPGTHWDAWVRYPFYPGYSNVGRVVRAGAEVEGWAPGDRVAARANHRQYYLVDAPRALRVPEEISDEEATWFGLGCIVQNGVRRAEHHLGDAVVVIGLGPLGQLVTQYARINGAREVIAIDTAARRLEWAAAHGATATLAMLASDARDAVAALADGRLADVVYDVTGHPASFPAALRLARRFGTVVLLGDTGTPSEQRLTADLVTRGLRVVGAHDSNPPPEGTDYAYWSHPNMARLFFTYLQRGQMRVGDLITHRYDPRQARECYEALVADRTAAMGVVFDWTGMEGGEQ
ncbi:MAG: zinc-binding alcohol dehydrogenase [Armatimonadetes bacterium]|nr:zinc-binding alcohol dehydrogenase [Armatimonadota bacterium]